MRGAGEGGRGRLLAGEVEGKLVIVYLAILVLVTPDTTWSGNNIHSQLYIVCTRVESVSTLTLWL